MKNSIAQFLNFEIHKVRSLHTFGSVLKMIVDFFPQAVEYVNN